MPPEFYGFYSLLIGSAQSIVDLAIYGAMQLGATNQPLLATMFAFMVASLLFSLAFAIRARQALATAIYQCDDPDAQRSSGAHIDGSTLQRVVT